MSVKSFWHTWGKLDELKQVQYVMYIAEMLDNYKVIKNKKQRLHAMANLMNSYFEDCFFYGKSIRK